MRRPLLSAAVLYGLGALVADAEAGAREALALLLLAALLLALAALAPERRALPALGAAALALGAAGAIAQALAFESGELRRRVSTAEGGAGPVRVTGVLREDPREQDGRLRLWVDVETVQSGRRAEPCPGRARVDVGGTSPWPSFVEGDAVALWATLRRASGPGGAREGVAAYGYCKSARLLEARPRAGVGPVRAAAVWARTRARAVLVRSIPPGPERGLVLAMVLGDQSEIDERTAGAFRASGTY